MFLCLNQDKRLNRCSYFNISLNEKNTDCNAMNAWNIWDTLISRFRKLHIVAGDFSQICLLILQGKLWNSYRWLDLHNTSAFSRKARGQIRLKETKTLRWKDNFMWSWSWLLISFYLVVVFFVLDGIYVPKSFVLSSFFFNDRISSLFWLLLLFTVEEILRLQVTSDEWINKR